MELKINFIAVLVAVAVNFVIGYLWFTPLFGKIWGKEMGFDLTQKPEGKVIAKGMALMVLGNFLFAWVFAHNIAAWQFVPGVVEMGHASNIMSSAIFTFIGFYLPSHLSKIAWENNSWKLFAINAGYNLVALLVVGTILSYWV